MRILVTGGNGFLGAAVAQALLARGDSVVSFDTARSEAPPPHDRRIDVAGDIADAAEVERTFSHHRPDAVVHCAAVVGVLASVGHPAQVVRVNVEGAVNLFEAMRRCGTAKCIHVSSEEVYGPFRADSIDETHPLEPVHPYGICKLAVEQLGRSWAALYGLRIVNLRTSWVYGPGLPRPRVPKTLVDAALAGRPLRIPDGADTLIDHTYVDDFVAGVLAALDHPAPAHDAYNVASGIAVSVADIARLVRELVPGADVSVGPGTFRYGGTLDIVRKGALDVGRARRDLGWRPRYDMRAGLAEYIRIERAGGRIAAGN